MLMVSAFPRRMRNVRDLPTMIEYLHYTYDQLKTRRTVFSDDIETNTWILYHATNSQVEAAIDSSGFGRRSSVVAKEHITQLLDIYERLNWFGISGGFSTLKGFTEGRSRIETPQTWFRETSMRSLTYAHRSFAGGECLMSFKRAFEDLLEFAKSATMRQEHLDFQMYNCAELMRLGAARPPVIRVNVDSMLPALSPLQNVYEACQKCVSQYKYGLLYAVRFEESDIPNLFNLRGSGILHIGDVPSYRIVGKATLHFGDIDDFEIYKLSGARDAKYQWDESQLAKAIRRNEPPTHYFPESKQASKAWLGEDISDCVASV
jgi:hypothetical protein